MSSKPAFLARATLPLLIAASLPALAQLPVYVDFELQARSNLLVNDNGFNLPPGSSFNSISPTLNDDGWVAFPVQVVTHDDDPGQSGSGVWHGRHGVGGIVHRHDGADGISTEIAINAAGQVAYRLGSTGNQTLWLYEPELDAVRQVGLLPLTPTGLSNLSLSDAGIVGYQGLVGSSRYFASTSAFPPPNDSVVHVYQSSLDATSPYNFLYSPSMNNQRLIAGKVNVGTGSDFSKEEIRLFAADGSSEVVASDTDIDPQSPFTSFDNSLAVNDHGQVAVMVRLAQGNVRAVYRLGDGEPVEIARVGGGPITEIQFFRPAINNDGLVAFRASDADGQAVFVGDGQSLVRVIGRGDVIETDQGAGQLGQHDASPVFGGAPDINNHGDVVVSAGLHPEGDNLVEWGSGIIVAWAERGDDDDVIFRDGFEGE
ncbi:MAG: hypothetical protein M0Q42_06100 [Xanthomonadales bacterium]|nr:hypothetical protein [Xanthomonadales bacterium]